MPLQVSSSLDHPSSKPLQPLCLRADLLIEAIPHIPDEVLQHPKLQVVATKHFLQLVEGVELRTIPQ